MPLCAYKDKVKNGEKMTSQVTSAAMKVKLVDEHAFRKESNAVKAKLRRELRRKLGENTRKYQKSIQYLREVARKTKSDLQEKYKKKLKHLQEKYKKENDSQELRPPEGLEGYEELSVFHQED